MPRRRKSKTPPEPRPNDNWVVSEDYEANGRKIQRDTELSITGESGRFRFMRHVLNPDSATEWIDVIGGPKGYKQVRSFRPDRIKRVHWKKKTGENLAAERKNAASKEAVQ